MKPKILTIDDSKMVRMIVAKTFWPHGCDVYEAGNGAEGLATAQSVLPDLIFLDITMADMNGLVVLEKIRQVEALKSTPVIMLTAESGNQSIATADKLKIIGYVAKPFKGEQLIRLACTVLDLQPIAEPA